MKYSKSLIRVEARTSRPPSGTRQILPSGFCAPQGRNPSAGLAPQAPFRKFWAFLGLAIVQGIVLGAGAIFRPRRPALMPLWEGPDGAPPMLAPGGIARAGPRLPPNTGRLAGTRAAPACHIVVWDGALSQNQYYLHSPSMQYTVSYARYLTSTTHLRVNAELSN